MPRKTTKKKTLKVVTPKKAVSKAELDYLPLQDVETVALYDMDQSVIEGMIDADVFREGLVKLKAKFLYEIQEWSGRHGIDADIRVYFTLKNKD